MSPTTLRSLVLLGSLGLLLAACAPTIANRGNLLDSDKLAMVKTGLSTREDVAATLGTPTQISTFDEKIWYYFGRHTQQYSFFDPEITEQQAVEVRFDDQGTVTSVKKLDPAAAEEIDPVDRRTPTYGHETTFFEQLIGNVGHGDAKKDKK